MTNTLKNKQREIYESVEVKNHSSFSEDSSFIQNIAKHVEALAFFRWYADLFLDLITPKSGGIKLGLDQRVFLRVLTRFPRAYCVFPRG